VNPLATVFLVDQGMYRRKALARSYVPIQWPTLHLPSVLSSRRRNRKPKPLVPGRSGRNPGSHTGSGSSTGNLADSRHFRPEFMI
jgi:hypothetical protein